MKVLLTVLIFFHVLSLALSQTGPGGVGNNTNNGLWLRADILPLANGAIVSSWSDDSGNGNNAIQITGGIQPTFNTVGSMNGMPTIQFDGNNDEMAVPDSPILDGTAGITYYAVIRPTNLNGNPRGILGKRITFTIPTEYAYTWFFYTGNRMNLDVVTQNNRFNSGATTFANNINYILSWDYDGTRSPGVRSRLRNGSNAFLSAGESSASLVNSNQDLALGALNVGYGTYLGAEYAEVIQYNYSLDDVDHLLVQNYLSAKYNIPLSSNDLYDEDDPGNGEFDFNVAGIGRISSTQLNNDAQGSGILNVLNPTDLDNDEYLIWGHNSGNQLFNETTDVPVPVTNRFSSLWRASEVNSTLNPVDVGSIDMRFDLTGIYTGTAADLYLLVDSDNDGVFSDEAPLSGAVNLGGNIYEFSGITAIENNLRFTLGTVISPLPIELLNFDAVSVDNRFVELVWQTSSETNNDFFTIERSTNGNSWEAIKTIDGAGTSSVLNTYIIVDKEPHQGVSYYRLKQTDYNGDYSYSQIRSVDISNNDNSVVIYPNPTNSSFIIKGDESELKNIRISNLLGKDVTGSTVITKLSDTKYMIDISRLSDGVYSLFTSNAVIQVYKK
jgi:hypothetical protein